MVYKRKYQYGGGKYRPGAITARQIVNMMTCIEKKYKDVELMAAVNNVETAVGNVLSLIGTFNISVAAAAPTIFTRTGKSIWVHSIQLFLDIKPVTLNQNISAIPAMNIGGQYGRIMAVLTRQNAHSTTPTAWTDILAGTGGMANATPFDAPRNVDKAQNYKILWDKKFRLKATNLFNDTSGLATQVVEGKRLMKVFKFKRPLEIQYDDDTAGATGTQGKLENHDIHLLFYLPTSAAGIFVYQMEGRIRFTD